MRSLFVSVTTRRHLNVVIMAAELLQATGGRVEQMEQQMGQMSGMQMSFSSTGGDFSFSTQLQKVSKGLSRTLKGGCRWLPSSSAMLSSGAHSIMGQGMKHCLLECHSMTERDGKDVMMVETGDLALVSNKAGSNKSVLHAFSLVVVLHDLQMRQIHNTPQKHNPTKSQVSFDPNATCWLAQMQKTHWLCNKEPSRLNIHMAEHRTDSNHVSKIKQEVKIWIK